MPGSTISGTITTSVTLGSAGYPSPLTVAGTGDIAVSAYGATGIYGPEGGAILINQGTVTAGTGSASSAANGGGGGDGVYLRGGNTATNTGTVAGGAGGNASSAGFYYAGSGGDGVYLAAGAALTNQALITGGAGGTGVDIAGNGGVGVYLAGGAMLITQATITGGAGGHATGGSSANQGAGGAGILLNGGAVTNSGAVAGGNGFGGRGYGGDGAYLLGGMLTNTGTIAGGSGDIGGGNGKLFRTGDGVYLSTSATLVNDGTIIGGYGLFLGGSGIYLAAGGTLTITGVVIGGGGAGKGVDLADGGSLDNTGTVTGGTGPNGGGTGIDLANGGTLTNAATVVGGGAYADAHGEAGSGGSGVLLTDGGLLVNTAVIAGGLGGIAIAGNGGTGGDGVDLIDGGTLINSANATISGGAGGYGAYNGGYGGTGASLTGGSVTNAGTISGGNGAGTGPDSFGGNGGTGVSLTGGGVVTNTGSIDGGFAGYGDFGGYGAAGVVMTSSTLASTLTNSGVITGGNGDDVAPGGAATDRITVAGGDGATVGTGDTLINTSTIVGATGVYVGAGGAFTNNGYNISGGDGVVVASGGTLINFGTVISGAGVYLAAGGTLTNAGGITGGVYAGVTADAVLFAAAGTLVVDPGGNFVGQVVGSASAADVLYLASGSSAGTLVGIGTQFVNFARITIGAGAYWTLTGANTVATGTVLTELSGATVTDTGTLVNNGAIALDPSAMTVAALTGTGSVAIDAASTLEVQGTISGGETLTFGGSGAYLHLDSPDSVASSVTNFDLGETIDLKGIDASTVSYSDSSGQLTFSGGDIPLALANSGSVHAATSADGTDVSLALCFCANTLILTPTGERSVQDLAVGDLVTTHRGKARPIVWIGVGQVLTTRGQRSAATPVIVRKGALAENVPNRDLRVTKGHAFWFGGALIPAEFLVNHRLIEWDDRAQEVSLYHIELATHDVLVANGAAAESYRDDGNRWLFRNANSGWDLPPQTPCAPVLTGGPFVDAVWRRLLGRAGPRPGFALTDDPDVHLRVDGERVDAGERRGTAYIFQLPARPGSERSCSARQDPLCPGSVCPGSVCPGSVCPGSVCPVSVRIISRAGAPAELGLARDPRVLGVAVPRIALRQGMRFRVIEAAEAWLREGFYPFEPADGLRWTNGDAALPEALFDGFDGPMELVLHVAGTTQYPLFGTTESPTVPA